MKIDDMINFTNCQYIFLQNLAASARILRCSQSRSVFQPCKTSQEEADAVILSYEGFKH